MCSGNASLSLIPDGEAGPVGGADARVEEADCVLFGGVLLAWAGRGFGQG